MSSPRGSPRSKRSPSKGGGDDEEDKQVKYRMDKLQHELEMERVKSSNLEKANEQLKKQMDDGESRSDKINRITKMVSSLKEQLDEALSENEVLQEEVEELKRRLANAGDAEEITKLKAQLADAKVNEELLKQRNEELRTSLATSKEDFEALQQQVSDYVCEGHAEETPRSASPLQPALRVPAINYDSQNFEIKSVTPAERILMDMGTRDPSHTRHVPAYANKANTEHVAEYAATKQAEFLRSADNYPPGPLFGSRPTIPVQQTPPTTVQRSAMGPGDAYRNKGSSASYAAAPPLQYSTISNVSIMDMQTRLEKAESRVAELEAAKNQANVEREELRREISGSKGPGLNMGTLM